VTGIGKLATVIGRGELFILLKDALTTYESIEQYVGCGNNSRVIKLQFNNTMLNRKTDF
jgi:hypothetical protein